MGPRLQVNSQKSPLLRPVILIHCHSALNINRLAIDFLPYVRFHLRNEHSHRHALGQSGGVLCQKNTPLVAPTCYPCPGAASAAQNLIPLLFSHIHSIRSPTNRCCFDSIASLPLPLSRSCCRRRPTWSAARHSEKPSAVP